MSRYAKRSVLINGRQYNVGDIIPESVSDEAAIAVHAFEEAAVTISTPVEEVGDAPVVTEDADEETFAVEVPDAELLLQSSAPVETPETVVPPAPVEPVVEAKGKKGKGNK